MYITSSDVTVRFLILLLFISVLDWSTPRIPFEIECMIVKVGEESEHAESIENAINTEPVVQVAERSMASSNYKLNHLHLSDPFLPGKVVKRVKGSQEVVAIHNDMDHRVHG